MTDSKQRTIQAVATKASLHAPKQDTAYWRTQPYIDRLRALENLRQQYHCWKYGAEPRLQRIYTVTKR
jgi:hypothetical protein